MNKQAANDQLSKLRPFQFCYVHTASDKDTTAAGAYVVNDKEGNIIFARRVNMLTREIIETEHFLGDEYSDIKEALEHHYSLEFITSDCIVLAFEMIRDAELYEVSLGDHEKYGNCVYYSDVDYLRTSEGEIETYRPTIEM